jgi:hypothetical protein
MPRRNKARRFEPRYGVSQAALEVEAGYLGREVEDYQVFAASDLEAKRVERQADCEHSWKHLHLLLDGMSEAEQRIIHCLVFRDLYLALELYLTYVKSRSPEASSASPSPVKAPGRSQSDPKFSEWLFGS